jgi:hypothetical protein
MYSNACFCVFQGGDVRYAKTSHAGNRGSSPLGVTNKINNLGDIFKFSLKLDGPFGGPFLFFRSKKGY